MNKKLYYFFTSIPYIEQVREPYLVKYQKLKKSIESQHPDIELILSNKSASQCKRLNLLEDIKMDLKMCQGVIMMYGWNDLEEGKFIYEHCNKYKLPVFVYRDERLIQINNET